MSVNHDDHGGGDGAVDDIGGSGGGADGHGNGHGVNDDHGGSGCGAVMTLSIVSGISIYVSVKYIQNAQGPRNRNIRRYEN